MAKVKKRVNFWGEKITVGSEKMAKRSRSPPRQKQTKALV
eukprot:CAMPEP_0202959452 /NCGR_PEP_ID=MMETSP1396-20130829/3641_1 /ASSEMBLY_ACC=CAM_ASM_000872 /TAXON_ID= /ORGANISM="Pseudokeronopsis sp., Strain Brazil" /LENGTH=39 /DNA_ID= /DNA_START= /DNA_END= /DNA_ORIENTATION=